MNDTTVEKTRPLGWLDWLLGALPLLLSACSIIANTKVDFLNPVIAAVVPAAALLSLIVFLVFLARTRRLFRRDNRSAKISRITMIILAVLVPCAASAYFGCVYFLIPLPNHASIRQTVQAHSDIDQIQAWAVEMIKSKEPPRPPMKWRLLGGQDYRWGNPNDLSGLPKFIRDLKPRYIGVHRRPGEQSSVRLGWGGGFYHWALRVGPSSSRTGSVRSLIREIDVREWKPGIYTIVDR